MAKRVESPSSINTFKQCKRKYYHQYIQKLPTLPNIHQVRGNIAHSSLENFFNIDVSSFTRETYALQFREAIQKLFFHYWAQYTPQLQELHLSKDQERFYFEETMLMLLNWTTHFVEEFGRVMKQDDLSIPETFERLTPLREQKFVSDVYSVQGFVDAIHHVGEEVHIVDYKTNSSFEFKDSIKLQLAIYSLLYFEKYRKAPSKVGIFFLRHKVKWMNVDEGLIELAKKEIELVHSHTSCCEGIEDYPKTVGPLCKWSTGQCDFYNICKPFESKK